MKKYVFSLFMILFLSSVPVLSQNVTEGLTGYWPLNGNLSDLSGNDRNGTGYGDLSYTPDRFNHENSALTFDNQDEYFAIPDDEGLNFYNHSFTLSLWFNSTIYQYWQTLFASSYSTYGFGLFFHDNKVYFYSYIDGNTSTVETLYSQNLEINNWYHVVITRNANNGETHLFINSVMYDSFIATGTLGSQDPSYYSIGGYNTNNLNGSIDDILVYDRVLSQEEIQLLYNNYSLTVSNGTGSGWYEAGQTVNISANPATPGYTFDGWTGDVAYVSNPGSSYTTVTMPTGNIAVTATYKVITSLWNQAENNIYYSGNVAIGRTDVPSGFNLAVDGKIVTREVKVTLDGWSDFVFSKDYDLKPIYEVEKHIADYKCLPGIPTEKEVNENGVNLGEINAKLLQKIEELTLYMIEMNKEIQALKEENKLIKEKLNADHKERFPEENEQLKDN